MAQTQVILPYNNAQVSADLGMMLEKRMEYSGDNLIYLGYNRVPNAATTDATWYIVKMTYSGDLVTRYQLPDDGPQFKYAWDNRATLFS